MSKDYSIKGREIYSAKGKLVATLDADGNPVMELGMAGAHGKSVREFLGLATASPSMPNVAVQNAVVKENLTTDDQNIPPYNESSTENALEDQGNVTMYIGSIPAAKPEGTPETVSKKETVEEWEISTIPEADLPPFSKEYGSETPGFMEYVKKHHLSIPQVEALVKRLEKR